MERAAGLPLAPRALHRHMLADKGRQRQSGAQFI
jgi:hypothetical protein